MPVLNTTQLITCGCPSTSGPTPDPDGSKTLVHVVDAAKNDFKVRCIKGLLSFHYEYSVSFPNGTSEVISNCIYDNGLNDAELVYTGTLTTTAGPTGTTIYTVGSILVVEHSNKEGTWSPSGNVLKSGGADFHMVYDYTHKFRYRLNTIVGGETYSTDYFNVSANIPQHSIVRAEAVLLSSPADFASALATDTAFRRLDDHDAVEPPEDCERQEPDPDESSIGYIWLEDDDRCGAVLFDAQLSGSAFRLEDCGIAGIVPPAWPRTRGSIAIQRTLLAKGTERLELSVDGMPVDATVRETDSMITLGFCLDDRAHDLRIREIRLS